MSKELEKNNLADLSESHRNSFYELKQTIYLVPGAKNSAIYDVGAGNIFSINPTAKEIILGQNENPEFSQELSQLGLTASKKPRLMRPDKKEIVGLNLEFVWFEILSDKCNERCLHCYADSMPSYSRKSTKSDAVTANQWIDLIKETYDLGCRKCQFIGGEPFFWHGEDRETVLDLAECAKNTGYEFVEIFTNGTLVSQRDIERIKRLGLNIAISLYSDDENIHDNITQTSGSFKKTKRTLELLKNAGIPIRVETVLMSQNQSTIESTNKFVQQMGFSHRPPDVLRPNGRGFNSDLQPSPELYAKYGLILEADFSTSPEAFKRNTMKHSCLAGKITITDNGNALPCIFSREKKIGNVIQQESVKNVLEGDIKNVWKLTKDDVLVCQDCEYRYACFDCRPLSEGASNEKGSYETAPYPRCTYNPYQGEWGNGTWKLNEKSVPFYDESLKSCIEEVRVSQTSAVVN